MPATALVERRIEPEWLDDLEPADPRARRSRRDLRRINALMGHRRILRRALLEVAGHEVPRRIVELGAGDGTLLLSVARSLAPEWGGIAVTLVDRQELVARETRDGFARLGWSVECIRADLPAWLAPPYGPGADLMVANLVLHHLVPGALRVLLARIAIASPRFVAVEPRRSIVSLAGSGMLGLIGCNDVTRHDAAVSVRAGFRTGELSRLWPEDPDWRLNERPAGLFSHLFTAARPGTERGGERA